MEIMKVLVLSTAHITEADNYKLEAQQEQQVSAMEGLNLNPSRDEYGMWVYTGYADDEDKLTFTNAGFSPAVYDVLQLGLANGCAYVRFDRDGEKLKDLPLFDW